jgi:hypothetical protein
MTKSKVREELYDLVRKWESQSRLDPRNCLPFQSLLDEILFLADLSFKDYIQFNEEGEFPARLKNWLNNVPGDKSKKALFALLSRIIFIDRMQIASLYRDAYRRIVIPFITKGVFSIRDILSIDYEKKVLSLMRKYQLCSITESFNNPHFLHCNNLTGLFRPIILGEDKDKVKMKSKGDIVGLIILEDFVGTGKQAKEVLAKINQIAPAEWYLLFVPIIILERGFKNLCEDPNLTRFVIDPVLVVNETSCIRENGQVAEPHEFKQIRAVVKATAKRVTERLDEHDDPPLDPFGYKGSGALVVTCHNTPNNTLALIHHRAPTWIALFRRIHHSKDGL